MGDTSLTFGLIGFFLGTFTLIEFFNFVPRIFGQVRVHHGPQFGATTGTGVRRLLAPASALGSKNSRITGSTMQTSRRRCFLLSLRPRGHPA